MSVLMQELGRSLTPCPLHASALMAVSALTLGASDEQQSNHLPGLADGSAVMAVAIDEHLAHRPSEVQCKAHSSGEGWLITGEKQAVIDGHVAGQLLVSARIEDELNVFLVPADAPGLVVTRTPMLDAHNSARVALDKVAVDDAARLAISADDWLEQVVDLGRIGQSGELLGLSERVLEMTLEYMRDRKQFGVAIASFQALQHRCALLYGEIEMLKSVVIRAAQVADAGDSAEIAMSASLAKAKACQVAQLACNEAIQLHGGIGMTDDYDLGFYAKRARALQQTLGDEYFHLDRFAKLNQY
jgi:acyl-CoA dehydrogenase